MATHSRSLAERRHERVANVIDLDRRESEPLEPGRRPGGAHKARQVVVRGTIAVAAEVDPREHDLAVALLHSAADFREHGAGRAAARSAAHERNDAKAAAEAAAVLHLHKRAHAVEPGVCLHAADRADVARDEAGRLLAPTRDDDDALR